MTADMERLMQLDEHLVCAEVAGRRRLGLLGVVFLPAAGGGSELRALFYDFIQDEQEPLLPVGTVDSMAQVEQDFGPLSAFFNMPEFCSWGEHLHTKQTVTPVSLARAYLCSTGRLQLPDSEELARKTTQEQSAGQPMGFGMSQQLVESWFAWSIREDENSRDYSRARKKLAQAIADAAK